MVTKPYLHAASNARLGSAERIIVGCGLWLATLGLCFILIRPALLPEDLRAIGLDLSTIRAAAPGLHGWLDKVFTVLGGFMIGAGLFTMYFGWSVVPTHPRGSAAILGLAGSFTVGLMGAVYFALNSDFRWLLVVPALAWAVAVFLHLKRPGGTRA